jgi:hypothetical protein
MKAEFVLLQQKVKTLLKNSFYPEKIKKNFSVDGDSVLLESPLGSTIVLPMEFHYRFATGIDLDGLSKPELETLCKGLQDSICTNRNDEITIIVEILKSRMSLQLRRKYCKRIVWLVKKIAFKKYKTLYRRTIESLKLLALSRPGLYSQILPDLEVFEPIAEKRLCG